MCEQRIYVACLAAYNSGYLHGKWIDVTDEKTIFDEIKQMLAKSPAKDAEEWEIHDHEGLGISFSGCIADAVAVKEFLEEYIDFGEDLLGSTCDLEQARQLAENYCGTYESFQDYAYQFIQDTCSEIPKHLEFYIDYERMGRDFEMNGDIFTVDSGYKKLHVFYSC